MTTPPLPPRPESPELAEGDAIRPDDPLFGTVWINSERMSGTPCFYGTRVPIKNLFNYLRAGRSVPEFLDDFPGVEHAQVVAVLSRAQEFVPPRGHAA